MYTAQQKSDLYYALMNEIGLAVNPLGLVIDQDTGIQLQYQGSFMRYMAPGTVSICGPGEVPFDPLVNHRLMNILFGYYWDKEDNMGNGTLREYHYTSMTKGPNGKETVAVFATTIDNELYASQYYYNGSLKFMDIILQRAGVQMDLKIFDEEMPLDDL